MSDVRLVTDGSRMAELLRSPTGLVGRHLIEKAELVKQEARRLAPVRSGCLRATILKRVEEDPVNGFAIRIVSDTTSCSPERKSYSLYVHEGTKPHIINAKPGGVLAFNWPAGPTGGMFFAASVNHPGTKARPFLRDALKLIAI